MNKQEDNTEISKKEVKDFYNNLVTKQKITGVNARHQSIFNKAVELGLTSSSEVLEIGCGIGTLTSLLIEHITEGTLHSVDISDDSISEAKNNLSNFENLTLEVRDATDFLLDKQFDFIIMPDSLEHIPLEGHINMFKNIEKMLKPNGVVYIHIPNPRYLEWCMVYDTKILQIIDQPLHLELFVDSIKDTSLFVFSEQPYTVWLEHTNELGWRDGDYVHRVLKRKVEMQSNDFVKRG